MKKLGVILLFGLCLVGRVAAAGKGTVGADFLKLGLGARAVGLGEAATAMVDGVEGLFWNAGSLGKLNKFEATFMRLAYLEDTNLNNLAYAQKIKGFGVVGAYVESLEIGAMPRTEIDGSGNYVDKGESFKAGNLAFGLGYGLRLGEKQGIGVVVKNIRGKIDDQTASAYAADLGWLYDLKTELRIGVAVQNIGTKMKYISEADKLPLRIRLGLGYRPIELVTVGIDVINDLNEDMIHGSVGAEYNFQKLAVVRAGYNTERTKGLDGTAGLSVGAGFKYTNYTLDYAFVPYGDLGDSHRISLGVKF